MTNDITKDKKRQVLKSEPLPLDEIKNAMMYITKQGRGYAEVTYMAKLPKKGVGGRMEALTETKQEANIRRAMKKLKGIIRANFGYDLAKEAHVTLTYKGVMKDKAKLQNDLEEWIRLLRYYYSEHKFDYVSVMEPHEHGGWHAHVMLKSDQPIWYDKGGSINYNRVRELWRKANRTGAGNVDFAKLPEDVKDFGNYFAAYFTTVIPMDIEDSGNREAIREASKAAKKGSRLKFYPANFKFYRCSASIVRPKTELDELSYDPGQMMQARRYDIVNDEGEIRQIIQCMEFQNYKDLPDIQKSPE